MEYLRLNLKSLTFILFIMLMTSCNNEEMFFVSESELIVEEIPKEETPEEEEEEEEEVNDEDIDDVFIAEAIADSFSTTENISIEMNIFDNDLNVTNLLSLLKNDPANGVLSVNNNNTPDNQFDDIINYSPNPGYFGTDSFEYTICDGVTNENCSTAIVTITVEAIEDDIATELKAFPSALGDGAYATGGRGGIIVHVTNLNNSGTGSLRAALEMSVPRIIVFDVSGVITLTSHIGMGRSNGNVTIAGQTAPEGGITIAGDRVYMEGVENIICRYIRFKGGANISNDSLTVTGDIFNHIFDHCSFSFGTDEGASWYSGTASGTDQNKITVQRCLWNENSKGSILGKLIGNSGTSPTGSFIYNMFYNTGYRFPNVAGGGNGVARFDVINNVSWTVTNRLIRGDAGFALNHIGNYYDYGTKGLTDKRTNLFTHGTIPQIYNKNNKIVAQSPSSPLTHTVAEMNANGDLSWGFFQDGGGYNYGDRLPSDYFTSQQHSLLGATFTPLTADQAFANVSSNVGCNARLSGDGSIDGNLDALDANALNQVSRGNYVAKLGSDSYSVPSIQSVSRGGNYDTDGDGMPDQWEDANGYDKNIDDSANDRDNDGYTNVEEFLNIIDSNN